MSYKKNGTDPTQDRKALLPGLPGGPSWAATVERMAADAVAMIQAALGMTRATGLPEDEFRHRRGGKGKKTPPKRRPNRLHISRRVRRKHRRAA